MGALDLCQQGQGTHRCCVSSALPPMSCSSLPVLCRCKCQAIEDGGLHTEVRTYLKVEGKEEALYKHSHAKGCLQHQQRSLQAPA